MITSNITGCYITLWHLNLQKVHRLTLKYNNINHSDAKQGSDLALPNYHTRPLFTYRFVQNSHVKVQPILGISRVILNHQLNCVLASNWSKVLTLERYHFPFKTLGMYHQQKSSSPNKEVWWIFKQISEINKNENFWSFKI